MVLRGRVRTPLHGVVRREVSPIGLCVRLSVGAINASPEQRMGPFNPFGNQVTTRWLARYPGVVTICTGATRDDNLSDVS